MFAIVYIYPYRTQSPDIALFSCLHWTLAVWHLTQSAHIFARAFPQWSQTCHVTGYGPQSLDALQTSTLVSLSLHLTVLQSSSFLMPYPSFSSLHCNFCNFTGHTSSHCPKYIAACSYTRTWRPASKQTVNDSHITLHSQNIIECARTAPTFETSSLMHQMTASFDWNTDSGATSHMTPHRHC